MTTLNIPLPVNAGPEGNNALTPSECQEYSLAVKVHIFQQIPEHDTSFYSLFYAA